MMPVFFGKALSLIEDALCPLTIYTTGFSGTPCEASFFSDLHKREEMMLISLDFDNEFCSFLLCKDLFFWV